jgi:putative inorganic carbon (hco3(-)) transporter
MEKGINKIIDVEWFAKFLAMAILFALPLYVIRFSASWLTLNLVEILIIFLILVWLAARRKELKLSIKKSFIRDKHYFYPIIFIIIGVAISITTGGNYLSGIGVLKGWFVFPVAFSIITYDLALGYKKLIKKYFEMIFYSGTLLSFFGFLYWLSGSLTYDGRLRMFYDSPNQLAMTLAPAFIIGIFLIRRKRLAGISASKLTLDLAAVLLIGTNLYFSKSAGALISFAAVCLVIFLRHKLGKKARIRVVAAILLVVLSLSLLLSFQSSISSKITGSRSSFSSRIMIWKSALFIGRDNPIFGIGPGNFQTKYLEYQKYFPPYLEWAVPQPHNLYLAFWLEAGMIGLVGFILLLVQFFINNKKAIVDNRLYGTLCFAIVLYFLFHGLVDTTYWKNDSAIIFWLVVANNYFITQKSKNFS